MTLSVLDDLNLAVLKADYPQEQHAELKAQTARAKGLWKRLERSDVPGVILGDEVGKGKTYIALALAFATLASRRRARILVLTHSKRMARTWAARWNKEVRMMVGNRWDERFKRDWTPRVVTKYEDFVDELIRTKRNSAIIFASYDTMKRFLNHDDRRRVLLGVLKHAYRAHKIRLGKSERINLVKEIVPDGGRMSSRSWDLPSGRAVSLLRNSFDPSARDWKTGAKRKIEDFLDVEVGRCLVVRPKLDLLIVDEAHKLEGRRRGSVVTCLLSKKFRKGVWVTATPFALTLEELLHRLEQFNHATDVKDDYCGNVEGLPFSEYECAVSERSEFPGLGELQGALRQQLVRSTWNHRKERRIVDWTGKATDKALLPSMALERVISNVIEHKGQTHVASVRETLCSSWAATLKSIETGALKKQYTHDPWVKRLENALSETVSDDPKLREAVERIARLAAKGEKTVVFTHRTATSAMLSRELARDYRIAALAAGHRRAASRWRERGPRVQKALRTATLLQARVIAKIIAHSADAPKQATPRALKAWWNRHLKTFKALARSADMEVFEYLEHIAGTDRRLPVVVRFDGEVSGGDETAQETVGNDQKFNLPCAPLILIASRKGQEAIDLHHYCRRVVLYDLPWNPALIEQRIGRVHRLGGLRSAKRPVEVVYVYQKGGYEELIAQKVKQRCEMMHALLGAGTWLEQDLEVDGLDRYRMTFPP